MASRLQKLTQALLAGALGAIAASNTTLAAIARLEDPAKARQAERRLPALLENANGVSQELVAPANIVIPEPLAEGIDRVASVRPPVAAAPFEGSLLSALDNELAAIATEIADSVAAQENATLVAALNAELDAVTESATEAVAQGSLGLALDGELDALFVESDAVGAIAEQDGPTLDELLDAELNELKFAAERDAAAANREVAAGAAMVEVLDAELTLLAVAEEPEIGLWAALDAEL